MRGSSSSLNSIPQTADVSNSKINTDSGKKDVGTGERNTRYSLKIDSDGNPYVVIDEDILDGVPKSQWVQTVRKELKSHRINMGAFEVAVNAITRNEYINSKYTKYIERTGEGVYADKLRMAGNIDEIVQNAYNTRNEDARHKNFPSFNRSEINVRIGNRDYAVEVVTGINFNNNEILYDIVGIRTTKIKEAKTGNKVSVKNTNPLTRSIASNKNISQENYTVNTSAQTRQENITKDNKNTKATGKATGLTIELVMMITRVVIIIKKPIIE